MNKLVVLFCVVVAASAAPHHGVPASTTLIHDVGVQKVSPLAYSTIATGPSVAISPVVSQQVVAGHVLAAAPVAYAAPAPVAIAAPAPVAIAAPAVAVARAPVVVPQPPKIVETESVGHVLTKNVHYAPQPVVTGYTSTVIKPDLGSIATPGVSVSQQTVAAPARAVDTIVPQVTQVQPELRVQKVPVDVPVATPVVNEVEVRTPVVQQAPTVVSAPAVVAAPAVAAAPVAAWAAAPAVAAAPVAAIRAAPVATWAAGPAVAAAPVATWAAGQAVAAAPVATWAAAPAVAAVRAAPVATTWGAAPVATWDATHTVAAAPLIAESAWIKK